MSLGLPGHLTRSTLVESYARAKHAVAAVLLGTAGFGMMAFVLARPGQPLWPAAAAVVAMGVALWLSIRFSGTLFGLAYLSVGAAAVFWFSFTIHTVMPAVGTVDSIWLALPKMALVMVVGAAAGPPGIAAWSLAGYLTAESVAVAAAVAAGRAYTWDPRTLTALLAVLLTAGLSQYAQVRARRTQPRLHRAAREEKLADLRTRMELKAAALLHDTVLGNLAAVAGSPEGPLDRKLHAELGHNLEVLVGREWLNEPARPAARTVTDWRQSGVLAAVKEGRLSGLRVEVSGDVSAMGRLDRSASTALGLAVRQCLVNVLKHAGTDAAEVAVYGSDEQLSVMVVDAGKGFDPAFVGSDRLGLRASVRRRIEAVGGTVRIWSTPGQGTSVLIQIPIGAPDTGDTRADGPAQVASGDAVASRAEDPIDSDGSALQRERTRQQLDPIGSFALWPSTVVTLATVTVLAAGMTMVAWPVLTRPMAGVAAVLLIALAAGLCGHATRPYRAPLTARRHHLIVTLGVAAVALEASGLGAAGHAMRPEWGPVALGLIFLALGPYRPARELAASGTLAGIFVGFITLLNHSVGNTEVPAVADVVATAMPVFALCYGAVAYSYAILRRLESWQTRFSDATVALGRELEEAMARTVQQDRVTILGRDVLPFFLELTRHGSIEPRHRERATEIAESVRAVMVDDVDRSWLHGVLLTNAREADGGTGPRLEFALRDDARSAGTMNYDQRTALRAFLVALVEDPVAGIDFIDVQLRPDGDRVQVNILARSAAPDASLRARFAPYFAVFRALFSALQLESPAGVLTVSFSYEQR